jgi:hypothetical protein
MSVDVNVEKEARSGPATEDLERPKSPIMSSGGISNPALRMNQVSASSCHSEGSEESQLDPSSRRGLRMTKGGVGTQDDGRGRSEPPMRCFVALSMTDQDSWVWEILRPGRTSE